jgi:hypothetical protein
MNGDCHIFEVKLTGGTLDRVTLDKGTCSEQYVVHGKPRLKIEILVKSNIGLFLNCFGASDSPGLFLFIKEVLACLKQ